ncbi:FAD binding domain of DNA photolyase-domain-containing protein [Blastocladiella britannica]|nr:FAD binding domain of DNA photolyase-domain-containing protein [Blastocladiella britannica]
MRKMASTTTKIVWFRRDLRLHDHPALLHASGIGVPGPSPASLVPVYCLYAPTRTRCGAVRWRFLLESLQALDGSLRTLGSRLLVVRGRPETALPLLARAFGASQVVAQASPEPHALERDRRVADALATAAGCDFLALEGRTLFTVSDLVAAAAAQGGARDRKHALPVTMTTFARMIARLTVPEPLAAPESVPPLVAGGSDQNTEGAVAELVRRLEASTDPATVRGLGSATGFLVPHWETGPEGTWSIPDLGVVVRDAHLPGGHEPLHPGGEAVALQRMNAYLADAKRVAEFEKPKTSPTMLPPNASTTILSPYIALGCLSPRLFYARIVAIYRTAKKHTQPPTSLLAQLYWREFFMAHGATSPNFGVADGNPLCVPNVGWKCGPGTLPATSPDDYAALSAWRAGTTGFPWIDALMVQLRRDGWVHHLSRHSLACFLTRGDLYVSWERGAEVFEEFLVDHDWALNRGNWMWLSGTSALFTSYWRIYSPVKWGQSWDPKGLLIKAMLPDLADLPAAYIYEPWRAPKRLIPGSYAFSPIVDHAVVSKANLAALKSVFADARERELDPDNGVGDNDKEVGHGHRDRSVAK